jgi:glycosyltransferase involved in cell wall biosynthesis
MSLVTICIPTHRRPSLLAQALLSCFAQDYRPLEIDIGDDSPAADTERLVVSLVPPSGLTIRYRHNQPGLGQSANVDALFAQARGNRLVLLHDDDVLLPQAISILDSAWRSAADSVLAYGLAEVVHENGELSVRDTENYNRDGHRIPENAGIRRDLLVCALWRQVPNDGYLVDSQAARVVGYRTFAQVGDACDTDFSIRLARHARGRAFVFVDRTTSQYRLNSIGLTRESVNISWRFFDIVSGLADLLPDEAAARDQLLAKIASRALVENAVHGRRSDALRIMRSPYYRGQSGLKTAYHVAVIALPPLARVRRLVKTLRLPRRTKSVNAG